MILLLVLFFGMQTPDPALATPVTFSTAAMRVDKAVKALGDTAGVALTASANIRQENLLLRLSKAPLGEVMTRIARSCAGAWHRSGSGYILVREEATDKAIRAERQADLAVLIQKALKLQQASVAKLPTYDSAYAGATINQAREFNTKTQNSGGPPVSTTFFSNMPKARFGERIVAGLDANQLATVPYGHRIVFATQPTSVEEPLRGDFQSAIDAYVKEENLWADQLEKSSPGNIGLLGLNPADNALITGTPDRLIVAASLDNFGGMRLHVVLYDSHHHGLAVNDDFLNVDPMAGTPDPKKDPAGKPITLTDDESLLLKRVIDALGGNQKDKPHPAVELPMRIIDRVARPDLYDPLAGYPSTALLATGDAKNLNIVADLPDIYFLVIASVSGMSAMTVDQVERFANLFGAVVPVQNHDGWLEIDGARTKAPFTWRADRLALSQLLSSCKQGSLSIEARARYAMSGGGGQEDLLSMVLMATLAPSVFRDIEEEPVSDLRLLGAVLEAEGTDEIAPLTTTFAKLPPPVVQRLFEIVFQTDATTGIDNRQIRVQGLDDFELCESFPKGLPPSGQLNVTVKNESVIFIDRDRSGGTRSALRTITPEAFANELYWENHPRPGASIEPSITKGGFKSGVRRSIEISMSLDKGTTITRTLGENHIPAGEFVSYDQLPAEFRTRVKTLLDAQESRSKALGN